MEKARAVLFIHHENLRGDVSVDVFDEDDNSELDPFHRAKQMWEAVKDDWPGAIHAIGVNEKATIMMRNRRMRDMGFTDGYPEYADEYIGTEVQAPL